MVDLAKLLKDIDDDIELTEILGESPEFNLRCKVAIRELAAERDALKAELSMEQNRRELAEEEIEALHLNFDDLGLPRKISDTLSLWGRATFLRDEIDAMRAEREAARKQEPAAYRIFDGEGNFDYCDKPEPWQVEWAARFNRKHEPLYASPVPAQQSAEVTPVIVEAAHEVTRALTALRHTRDAFEIGGLIRSDLNSICDVLDVTASKLFQMAKGGENG